MLGQSTVAVLVLQPNKSTTNIVRTISIQNTSYPAFIPLSRTGTIMSDSNGTIHNYWLYGRTTKKRILFRSDISLRPLVVAYADNTRVALFESVLNDSGNQTGLKIKIYDISRVPVAPVFTVDCPLLEPISTHTIRKSSPFGREACGGIRTSIDCINSGIASFYFDYNLVLYDLTTGEFIGEKYTMYYKKVFKSDGTFFYTIGNHEIRRFS